MHVYAIYSAFHVHVFYMYMHIWDDQNLEKSNPTDRACTVQHLSFLACGTVEPPNKGHIEDNINSLVSSFVQMLSSSLRLSVY